jgi:photosystem II stability/assembly factor-like uncharacterized protein
MKYPPNRAKRPLVWLLTIVIACVAQAPMTGIDAIPDSSEGSEWRVDAITRAGTSAPGPAAADSATRFKLAEAYSRAPLTFEADPGPTGNTQVKFLSRGDGYNLFLTATGAMFSFLRTGRLRAGPSNKKNAPPLREPIYSQSQPDHNEAAFMRISLLGADKEAKVNGVDELPGKSNYFIGDDPQKWRTNVPTYSRVKYESIYPGVDLLFYGNQRQLEYDFIVAPGASFKSIKMAFEGADRIRLNSTGDLLIETPLGEIRQSKPVIYQETVGAKRSIIGGGYVIRGEMEVGFEVGDYDPSRSIVIDPVFEYSTSIGGGLNDSANAIAVDAEGNAYITGITNSSDFPTVNPFQPILNRDQISLGNQTDAFVMKLNPSGTTLLYSTFLGGSSSDEAFGIAVDPAGNAYLTGYTRSSDFPTTRDAFQTRTSLSGDAFTTKLNPKGNALVYSTFLGGPSLSLDPLTRTATVGRGIAVDTGGSAYVAGYTFSPLFPLKKAAQDELNRGVNRCCSSCFNLILPARTPEEDAFVTKLNPSGTGLDYSTYLGGDASDEAYALAIDSAGNAYVTGRTCSRDFSSDTYAGGNSDAFVVKLSVSGRQFVYSRLLGGSGDDKGNGVAVDSSGNAYVTGQTDSNNFPTSLSAFQPGLGGSASYVTRDGGGIWLSGSRLPNSRVNGLAVDPTNPLTVFAGLGDCTKTAGVFKSTDGGNTWQSSGLMGVIVEAIAIDPKQPSTVYACAHKSTDGGVSWTQMIFPDRTPVFGARTIAIDPVNTDTVYLISSTFTCGDVAFLPSVFKSTNGGGTWQVLGNGVTPLGFSSLVLDPKQPSTLYATSSNLLKSTDGGNSWRVQSEALHNLFSVTIDPINPSTLYLQDIFGVLHKTTDGGVSFRVLETPASPQTALAVDPTNSAILYAASGTLEKAGAVFKSTDGGQTWTITELSGLTVIALAINPVNSSQVHAGAVADVDGFAALVNASGVSIQSTYIGSRGHDFASAIALDSSRNFYVTGRTFSNRFPMRDPLQAIKPGGLSDSATFTAKMDNTGSALLFSTYLGGNESSSGSGIAVDAAGKIYVAGTTGTPVFSPTASSIESVHGGLDAFVVKLTSPPRIAGVSVSGKNLIVTGEGFDNGAVILVDGVEQRTRNDQSNPAMTLIGKKAARAIASGQRVIVQVRNSDGLRSEPFGFTRQP